MSIKNWFRWLSRRFTQTNRRQRRANHWQRFRPTLEALEDRSLPSCVVFANDGTLFIRGDDAANVVAVVASADSVSVQCDQARAVTFDGIRQIVADLGGGDDTFNGVRSPPPDPETQQTSLGLVLRTGAGNDVINLVGAPASDDSNSIDLGDGNDVLGLSMHTYVTNYGVTINGRGGQDEINVEIGDRQGRPTAVAGRVSVYINGGDDIDRINMGLKDVTLGPRSVLTAEIGGGDGADALSFNMNGVSVNGKLDVSMSGFEGDDQISTHIFDSPTFSSATLPPAFALRGGAGNDQLVHRADNPAGDVECDGGDGDDTITVVAEVDWTKLLIPNPPPGPPPVVHFGVTLRGGAGLDRISSRMGIQPTPFLPPLIEFDLVMDGGAGDDVLDAEFRGDVAGQKVAELNVAQVGGDGNDQMRLVWSDGAFDAIAFADGGAGFDSGLFSPGVKHVNVEKVG